MESFFDSALFDMSELEQWQEEEKRIACIEESTLMTPPHAPTTNQGFPWKLYEMLETVDPRIMSWNASGDGFNIFDVETLTKYVLVKYFRHQKYTSFQRNLNLYGFHKIVNGSESYTHPTFQRSAPYLISNVIRKTSESARKTSESARFFEL